MIAALTQGLPHAQAHVHDGVQVGFSLAEPAEWLGDDDDFWKSLTSSPYAAFAAHVDYVGLGRYPDGFSPHDDVHGATLHALDHLRRRLAEAHFPAGLPIHIAEAGSPSGAHRTPAGQVSSLTALIDASAATSLPTRPIDPVSNYPGVDGVTDAVHHEHLLLRRPSSGVSCVSASDVHQVGPLPASSAALTAGLG